MKQEDEYYEKWLHELRTIQPVRRDPNRLTAAIVERVSQKSGWRQAAQPSLSLSKSRKVQIIGRWLSVAVAGLLLCLLVGETFLSPTFISMDKEEEIVWKATPPSLPDHWGEMSRIEKGRYVSSVCQQKEQQRMKRAHLLENRVKNQTKSVGYEKE